MSNQEITALRAAVAELQGAVDQTQQSLRSVLDGTHAALHLLAFVFATRCMASPDPLRTYKDTAKMLLASIGGPEGTRKTGDPAYDDALRGIRHHVSQFLLTLKTHVEANIAARQVGRPN